MQHHSSKSEPVRQQLTIHASTFQPFASRIGLDMVIRLEFPYDPTLTNLLKRLIAAYRSAAVDPRHYRLNAGGWLPTHKVWFVEPCVWGVIRDELQLLGYRIKEGR